jgi:cytochrome c2
VIDLSTQPSFTAQAVTQLTFAKQVTSLKIASAPPQNKGSTYFGDSAFNYRCNGCHTVPTPQNRLFPFSPHLR